MIKRQDINIYYRPHKINELNTISMSNPKEIHHIAEDLANAVFNTSQEDFLRQMRLLHRTNQQMFAGLVLLWMQDYVNYDTDGRNHYSVGYFKKMLEAFMAAYPDEPLRKGFPLV